ncbi:hypothetical protein [Dinghuibacter silviterrae]|uniref:Uncharacterized protein n=1 Tax=Dinghuibacter silviterrae TaxID=1539049 RepID=A0A4R8DGK0_9BACT|nr:hypothetical protein [Dinghuibacter silviterrae]TDW96090.1 hypothetical protein EDB95_3913 [Dinghuibacter silviterrae]
MKEYKFSVEGQKAIREKIATRLILVYLFAGVCAVSVVCYKYIGTSDSGNMLWIIIPLICGWMGWNFFRVFKRQKETYATYTVTLTDNLISREASTLPTVAIYRDDIKKITRLRNGTVCVKGKDPRAIIPILPEIDGFEELTAALAQTMPIEARRNELVLRAARIGLSLSAVALFIAILYVNNKAIATGCGVLLVALSVWRFWAIRRSRNVDLRAKQRAWVSFVFILLVVGLVVAKWMSLL